MGGAGSRDIREAATGPNSIEALRARGYELLAALLTRAPDSATLARLSRLRGDRSDFGDALTALAAIASATEADAARREFHALFIGVTRGELVPYASFYRSGFLMDRPLAELRADLAALGLARAPGVVEPEDHISFLCEAMAVLIGRPDSTVQRDFHAAHLAPWAGRFFSDLQTAPSARFYAPVGRLGRVFFEIEAHAFALTPA